MPEPLVRLIPFLQFYWASFFKVYYQDVRREVTLDSRWKRTRSRPFAGGRGVCGHAWKMKVRVWGHPQPEVAEEQGNELCLLLAQVELFRRLHVTMFYEYPPLSIQRLLPLLNSVQAQDLVVEAYPKTRYDDGYAPPDNQTFRLEYYKDLGPFNSPFHGVAE